MVGELHLNHTPIQPYIKVILGIFRTLLILFISYSYDLQRSGAQRMFCCKKSNMLGTVVAT